MLTALIVLVIIGSLLPGDSDDEQVSGDRVRELEATIEALVDTAGQQPTELAAGGVSVSDQCSEFSTQMAIALGSAAGFANAITDLSVEAAINPLVTSSAAWQSDLRAAYQSPRRDRDHVASLEAPTALLEQIRVIILSAFDQSLASEAPFLQGADKLDADLLDQAAALIAKSTDTFAQANTMIPLAAC